jgi:hypothetical protein
VWYAPWKIKDEWCLKFTPPLNIPGRTKVDIILPPPPFLGGPVEFDIDIEFESLDGEDNNDQCC